MSPPTTGVPKCHPPQVPSFGVPLDPPYLRSYSMVLEPVGNSVTGGDWEELGGTGRT